MSIGIALGLHLGRSRRAIKYLLGPFRFATDQAAPLPATYTEAGAAGALVVTDPDGDLAVSGGQLRNLAVAGANNKSAISGALTRVAGRALLVTYTAVGQSGSYPFGGWTTTGVGSGLNTASPVGAYLSGTSLALSASGDLGTWPGYTLLTATDQVRIWFVLRGTGAFIFTSLNGAPPRLAWVSNTDSTATLYAALRFWSKASGVDDFRVTDLPAPFNTDYGLATSRLVNPASGATFTHTADCVLEHTFTWASSAHALCFRSIDVNNEWRLSVNSDGSAALYQVTAGAVISRASIAAGTITAAAHRIVVTAVGNTYTWYLDNVQKGSYTDPSSQGVTATAGVTRTGGSTEIVAWPRTVTLPNV